AALGGHGNSLQARRAKTIDSERRDLDRQAGTQGGDTGHVHSLLGFGHGAAEDYILNFFGIELRHALERTLNSDRGQFIGTGGAKRAFESTPHGGANGGSNDNFTHKKLPHYCSAVIASSSQTSSQ